MKTFLQNILIFSLYSFWLGILFAISFLETPLKFQVPGITLPFALELGKLMFGISTSIQLGLSVVILFIFLINKKFRKADYLVFGILLVLLLLEKTWFLPVLDARAELISSGKAVPPSNFHNIFIGAEVTKLILLVFALLFECRNIYKLQKPLKNN